MNFTGIPTYTGVVFPLNGPFVALVDGQVLTQGWDAMALNEMVKRVAARPAEVRAQILAR